MCVFIPLSSCVKVGVFFLFQRLTWTLGDKAPFLGYVCCTAEYCRFCQLG